MLTGTVQIIRSRGERKAGFTAAEDGKFGRSRRFVPDFADKGALGRGLPLTLVAAVPA